MKTKKKRKISEEVAGIKENKSASPALFLTVRTCAPIAKKKNATFGGSTGRKKSDKGALEMFLFFF